MRRNLLCYVIVCGGICVEYMSDSDVNASPRQCSNSAENKDPNADGGLQGVTE